MPKQYWMVKSEPEAYSWELFLKEGRTSWTGVRNFQARIYLRQMKAGDSVLFYHSVAGKAVVGIARVEKEAYADITATEGDWSAVDLVTVKTLKKSVTLDQIKSDDVLKNMPLVKQSRLSVMPVTFEAFKLVLKYGETKV
jgi:predicted RNA-binding protein with PUA-like domain